jgi:uncharacterized membrane protein YphA (DoxX/SURF4 family)
MLACAVHAQADRGGAAWPVSNYGNFVGFVEGLFAETWLPMWLVTLEARLIPGVEILLGALLFAGYQTRWALLGCMALLATLLFGMILLEDWEIVARHLIYALCFFLLLHNSEFNKVSLDHRMRGESG